MEKYGTCILGAYGSIMFALWVWVDFGASWKGGPLCENCSFLSIPTSFQLHVRLSSVRKDTLQNIISETLLANSQQPLGVTFAFFWHFINEI